MRITAELISLAPAFLNPLRERQLSLRGYKIPAIENLGSTKDSFDTIDFSDNEILKIDNFPILKRLITIIANNNKISLVADNLGQFLPKLETLILTNNRFQNLSDLNPLAGMELRTENLIGNPITRVKDYRLYVIALLPKIKLIDFQKVKPQERLDAVKRFGVIKAGSTSTTVTSSLAASGDEEKHIDTPAKTFTPGQAAEFNDIRKLTPELKSAIKLGIANATTLEEIDVLERALTTGKIPRSLAIRLNLPLDDEITAAAAMAADNDSVSSNLVAAIAVDADMETST